MFEIILIAFGAVLALSIVVLSADELIHHSISFAQILQVPSFLVGVLIVGVGTSSPEALVSLFAGLEAKPNLSAGNAAGSNIVNTALLALAVLFFPKLHSSNQARFILLLLLFLHWLIYFLIDDSFFEFSDGLILMSVGLMYIVAMVAVGARRQRQQAPVPSNGELPTIAAKPIYPLFICIFVSLGLLLLSAKFFVDLTVIFCQKIGISDLVIGLTVVALGTSIPEISASIQAARRGAIDISLGNMLGSMTFNLSAVFAFATLSGDVFLDPVFFARDFYCLFFSFLLCSLMYFFGGSPNKLRAICIVIIVLYLLYTLELLRSQLPEISPIGI